MCLEVVTLEHLPVSHIVHLALFRNVQNAAFLHQQLLAKNTDFEYGFIDASVVCSLTSPEIHPATSSPRKVSLPIYDTRLTVVVCCFLIGDLKTSAPLVRFQGNYQYRQRCAQDSKCPLRDRCAVKLLK